MPTEKEQLREDMDKALEGGAGAAVKQNNSPDHPPSPKASSGQAGVGAKQRRQKNNCQFG